MLKAKRFSLKEQTLFAKRLAFLINAGIPVVESLHMLREQGLSRGHRAMLDQIIADTQGGQSLSRSFSKFPKVFSDFSVHIVRVGESSGTLSLNLTYLADELRKRHTLRRKMISAFIYPAVITLATIGITVFLMIYLFPKIMPVFSSLHATLPLTTRVVIAVSTALQAWGLVILGVLLLSCVLLLIALRRSPKIHRMFDRALLRLPLFGSMIRNYNIANACRTLGLLLKSGVKLSEALPITGETSRNLVYKEQFLALSAVVNRGEKLSSHLVRESRYFPEILTHMVAVGEKSGTLSETLVYLSELFDGEVDDFTKNLSTLVEPALMVFMGVLVGFIAISIITPIYGITQSLHT